MRSYANLAPLGKRVLAKLTTTETTKGGIVLPRDPTKSDSPEAWKLTIVAVSWKAERRGFAPGQVIRALRHACVELDKTAGLYTVQPRDIVACAVEVDA